MYTWSMTMRVCKLDGGLAVKLPADFVAEEGLREGDEVAVKRIATSEGDTIIQESASRAEIEAIRGWLKA